MDEHWKKVVIDKVENAIDRTDLEPAAAALLKADMRPESFIHALTNALLVKDAVGVMARILPPRETIWWACVCARQMPSLTKDRSETLALEAAEKWVYEPKDKNRIEAFRLAQESSSRSAGALAALAAAFSAGTIPVSHDQFIKIEPGVVPQLVEAAVTIAACDGKPADIASRFQQFLDRGENVARGGNGDIGGGES